MLYRPFQKSNSDVIVLKIMLAAVDVHYRGTKAIAGCVQFDDWQIEESKSENTITLELNEPYQPGQFYKRELPCVLAVLESLDANFESIIVDGYVWLASQKPGMGYYLFKELGSQVPIIGVAKNSYSGNDIAQAVLRGRSKHPLFVTSAGIDCKVAAEHIANMHGKFRLPTILKRVDKICRDVDKSAFST